MVAGSADRFLVMGNNLRKWKQPKTTDANQQKIGVLSYMNYKHEYELM
jgi:hypothetical protein